MVYDTRLYSSTDLAKNSTLIQSLLSKNPTWTETDVRRKVDEAWSIMEGCAGKKNKAVVLEHDGNCCIDCGSINLSPTGNCKVCLQCGASQGCS